MTSVGGVFLVEKEKAFAARSEARNAFSLTSWSHTVWNSVAYCPATFGSSSTMTWFEFTYSPVTEKFVDPTRTFLGPEPSETTKILSWA